jgi:hypothetical protein
MLDGMSRIYFQNELVELCVQKVFVSRERPDESSRILICVVQVQDPPGFGRVPEQPGIVEDCAPLALGGRWPEREVGTNDLTAPCTL